MVYEMYFHLLHLLLFSEFFPLAPSCSLVSPYVTGSEMRTQGLAVEMRLERCVRLIKMVSQPSIRSVVLPCRPRKPQLMTYRPEGTTKSWMVFCKSERN